MPKLWMPGTGSVCAALLLIIGRDALGAAAEPRLAEGPMAVASHELGIGRLIPDLERRPVSGKALRLSQLKPKSPIVIAFTSTSCPVANRYAPTLAALEKQWGSNGTTFIFVDPLSSDSEADIKQAA